MVNNIYLNFDAFHGDKAHGGVHDGTTVVLWEWCEGDNQRWKIVPWCMCFHLFSVLYNNGHHHLIVFSSTLQTFGNGATVLQSYFFGKEFGKLAGLV
jgi:hypothetical protein